MDRYLSYIIDEFMEVDISFLVCDLLNDNDDHINSALFTQLRNQNIRMVGFFEEWIDNYLHEDFFLHFRMYRTTFKKLLLEVMKDDTMIKTYHGGNIPVNNEKGLLITIWYLAKGETYISVSDRFNIACSAALKVTEIYIKRLICLITKFIIWPTENECVMIEEKFKQRMGYPGVIGAIDGCHIYCKVPESQYESYTNRKMSQSIILQGICTADKIFTNIFVGFPGSAHDSRVFRNSSLFKEIESKGSIFYFYNDDYHLVGDSAYPLKNFLMTPYRDNGRLQMEENNHNFVHSVTRVPIEHAFGLLKGRWRILQYVNVYSIEKVIDIVTSCCVLHNFCYLNNDNLPDLPEDFENDDQPYCDSGYNNNNDGQIKRNGIAYLLRS